MNTNGIRYALILALLGAINLPAYGGFCEQILTAVNDLGGSSGLFENPYERADRLAAEDGTEDLAVPLPRTTPIFDPKQIPASVYSTPIRPAAVGNNRFSKAFEDYAPSSTRYDNSDKYYTDRAEESVALLVNIGDDVHRIRMGTIERVDSEHRVCLKTENGEEFIPIDKIAERTETDLRDRTRLFAHHFSEFESYSPNHVKGWIPGEPFVVTENYSQYSPAQSQKSLAYYRHQEEQETAFLIRNDDGTQRLVIGKGTPLTSFVDVPGEPQKVEVLSGFRIRSQDEKSEDVRPEQILMMTAKDIRDREAFFWHKYERFGPYHPYQVNRLQGAVGYDLRFVDMADKLRASKSEEDIKYYSRGIKPYLQATKRVRAFLIQRKGGFQEILEGTAEPIVEPLTQEVIETQTVPNPDYRLWRPWEPTTIENERARRKVTGEIITGFKIQKTDGTSETVSANQILQLTDRDIRDQR